MLDLAPLTVEQVRSATFSMKLHLNMDDCHVSVWESSTVTGLAVVSRSPKGRSNIKGGRFFRVAGVEQEFTDLEEAIGALNKVRARAAADREWEAAAPAANGADATDESAQS